MAQRAIRSNPLRTFLPAFPGDWKDMLCLSSGSPPLPPPPSKEPRLAPSGGRAEDLMGEKRLEAESMLRGTALGRLGCMMLR